MSRRFKIAIIAKGDRGSAKNITTNWEKLKERLADPVIDKKHTLDAYLELDIDVQNRLKDVGSFVGGPFYDGVRRKANLEYRSIITLDIDAATPKTIERVRDGKSAICKYEFFGSTTRKHTADKPRWRFIFPITRNLNHDEYVAVSRILASTLCKDVDKSMKAVDPVSYRPPQIMYWPSVCKKALFETVDNPGDILDPDALLESFNDDFGDWRDFSSLPQSPRENVRGFGTDVAEVPTEKDGLVGAFCRVYDVPAAIEEFLSDVYVPGDPNSSKPRYSYVHGSSSNGAIVEDGGDFLYSYHGTDPCAERLVNAFDMVRIHLFGDLDLEEPDDTPPTEMPSFRKMVAFCKKDADVRDELENDDYTAYTPEMYRFSDISDEKSDEDEEKPKKPNKNKKKETKKGEKPKKSKEKPYRFAPVTDDEDDDEDEEPAPKKKKKEKEAELVVSDVGDSVDESVISHASLLEEFPAPTVDPSFLGPFWAKRAEKWALAANAYVDFSVITILYSAFHALGMSRKGMLNNDNWGVLPIAWFILIAPSGDSKSPALGIVQDIFKELEDRMNVDYDSKMAVWETEVQSHEYKKKLFEKEFKEVMKEGGDVDALSAPSSKPPTKPHKFVAFSSDATVDAIGKNLELQPKGFGMIYEEAASFVMGLSRFQTTGSDTKGQWLTMYDGKPVSVLRKTEGLSVSFEGGVSLLMATQPVRVHEMLDNSRDGFHGRFIYSWPTYKFRPLSLDLPNVTFEAEKDILWRLMQLKPVENDYGRMVPKRIKFSKEARAAIVKTQNEMGSIMSDVAIPDDVKEVASKNVGHIARIALVLEYLWWATEAHLNNEDDVFESDMPSEPKRVSLKAVQAAQRFYSEYVYPMQQRTVQHYKILSVTSDTTKNVQFCKWLLERGAQAFTERYIKRHVPTSLRAESGSILKKLLLAGFFEVVETKGSGRTVSRTYKWSKLGKQSMLEFLENS